MSRQPSVFWIMGRPRAVPSSQAYRACPRRLSTPPTRSYTMKWAVSSMTWRLASTSAAKSGTASRSTSIASIRPSGNRRASSVTYAATSRCAGSEKAWNVSAGTSRVRG